MPFRSGGCGIPQSFASQMPAPFSKGAFGGKTDQPAPKSPPCQRGGGPPDKVRWRGDSVVYRGVSHSPPLHLPSLPALRNSFQIPSGFPLFYLTALPCCCIILINIPKYAPRLLVGFSRQGTSKRFHEVINMSKYLEKLSSHDLFLELEAFTEGRSTHAWRSLRFSLSCSV